MKIFLDSSVLLSACGSAKSLSRLITEIAPDRGWRQISASYCRAETSKNIGKLGAEASLRWPEMQAKVEWVVNALTSHRPLLLAASKDKPVLISALAAKSEVLLTLDKADFGLLLGTTVYGMAVSTPRDFLVQNGLSQRPRRLTAATYLATLRKVQTKLISLEELAATCGQKPKVNEWYTKHWLRKIRSEYLFDNL